MALTLYYGSGSQFSWRVQLALEHKHAAYEAKLISFSAGDHKTAEFAALNPRHKVPVLRDDDFVLFESAAIVEYLEERLADGPRLFPSDLRERAVARRLIREIDTYLAEPEEELIEELFFKRDAAEWDLARIERGRAALLEELAYFERTLGDSAGASPAVDYTLYPFIALMVRLERRKNDLGLTSALGPVLRALADRVEKLPFYDATYPPHWR
jgi:glutathione S-transferase